MVISILQWLAMAYLIGQWFSLHRRVAASEIAREELQNQIILLSFRLEDAEREIENLKPHPFE
ncbi:hypothetical protein [Burkholderia cepacia]|uniref:hypothetical protein n=1 Tax=Burkholderia cepacia TaxID=292 RepID=UPI00398EDA53